MADHKRRDKSDDEDQFQKEFDKLKELAENGMELTDELRDLKNSDNPILNIFADNIIAFENAFKNPDNRPLREILGNPIFPKVDDLVDDKLEDELEKLEDFLDSKGISLHSIYPTESREIYRFITEELLDIADGYIDVPGMSLNFIYEEFYPNHPEDIRCQIEAIVIAISEKEFNEGTCWRRSAILYKKELHDEYLFMAEINRHLEIFDELTDPEIEFIEVEMHDGAAKAQCGFTVTHETSNGEKVFITGNAKFEFELLHDFYVLAAICIPEMGI